MEEPNNIDKILIGYDRETQQKIRELYKLDKMSLILHILNIEEFINQPNKQKLWEKKKNRKRGQS